MASLTPAAIQNENLHIHRGIDHFATACEIDPCFASKSGIMISR